MKAISYRNTLSYIYDENHPVAHYQICGKYRNRGEICESIAKHQRGLFTLNNPATSYDQGSDIEEYRASIKSPSAQLAHNLYGTPTQQIKTYFKNVHSINFVYVDWDEETQNVTEYWMNKSEFGAFVRLFTTPRMDTRAHRLGIRFKQTTTKMRQWLNTRCEC